LVNLSWIDFKDPPLFLIQGQSDFAIEDLTIYASNHLHIISGGFESGNSLSPGRIRIERVTVRASSFRGHLDPSEIDRRLQVSRKITVDGADSIQLAGDDLMIVESDIYGSGRSLYLKSPHNAYVANNKFYNGRWGWYSISGADGVIFENNEIIGADLMSTGGGINTLRGNPQSSNVIFYKNKFTLMNGWDREALTSDGPGGFYYGRVKSIGRVRISLIGAPDSGKMATADWVGAGVFIIGGRGMGQYAQVATVEGSDIILDHAFTLPPDEDSVITITQMQKNYLLIDNEFSDTGVAIQFYGTSLNQVVAGNKSTRTAGFFNSGRWYHHYQPSWYTQFIGNEIVEGNYYRAGPDNLYFSGEATISSLGLQRAPNDAPLNLGTVIKNNVLHSNSHIEINGTDTKSPGVRDIIVEGNDIENSNIGIAIGSGVAGALIRNNKFFNVVEPLRESPKVESGK